MPVASATPNPGEGQRARGLIITLERGGELTDSVARRAARAAHTSAQPSSVDLGPRTVVIQFAEEVGSQAARAAADVAAAQAGVTRAEPDWVISADPIREPRSESMRPAGVQQDAPWGLDRIDQRAGLDGDYTYDTTGAGVIVYVVDSGIRTSHIDFAGRIAGGYTVVDDGWGVEDCDGHGTHVAGTIGGSTYGVAKGVTLVPVRVLDCNGEGYSSDTAVALSWIAGVHPPGVPGVVNMSMGAPGNYTTDSAVEDLINAGLVVAVSSGNGETNSCSRSPARVPGAITVNASDSDDDDAWFSNFGPCSDIYAPGVTIESAGHNHDTDVEWMSGTSMASPHVAGAAARVWGANPSWSAQQIWAYLDSQSTYVDFGYSEYGDPNKLLYLEGDDGSPDPPTGVYATAGPAQATVQWGAPSDSGDAPISYYTATASPGGAQCASSGALSCVVSGLRNGTSYTFTVTATNPLGTSPPSAPSGSVVPLSVPDPPIQVMAVASPGRADVTWSPPVEDGGSPIQLYTATATPGGQTCSVTGSTSCTIYGITNGSTYLFTVTAVNAIGRSAASVPSPPVTPRGSPSAPRAVQAKARDGQAVVRWQTPATDGGAPVVSYTVIASPGGQGCVTGGALSCVVNGLRNGTMYSFSVTAANSIGVSPAGVAASGVRPEGVPGPVRDLKATSVRKGVKVTWKQPLETGGSAPTRYQYQVGRQKWKAVGGISVTVKGNPGGRVVIKVRAVTAAGPGPSQVVIGRPA